MMVLSSPADIGKQFKDKFQFIEQNKQSPTDCKNLSGLLFVFCEANLTKLSYEKFALTAPFIFS